MSEQENTQVMRDAYAAIARGDGDAYLDFWAEDCEYYLPGDPAVLPWAGTFRGKSGVRRLFEIAGENVEFELFEGQKFVAQGDTVVVLGSERFRVKATGKLVVNDFAYVYTLRDGKLVTCREYNDSAAQLAGVQTE